MSLFPECYICSHYICTLNVNYSQRERKGSMHTKPFRARQETQRQKEAKAEKKMYIRHNLFILVHATTALLTHPARIHIALKECARAVLAVTRVFIQDLLDGQARIQANKVSQCQWTHRHVGAQLHGRVNVLRTRESLQDQKRKKQR